MMARSRHHALAMITAANVLCSLWRPATGWAGIGALHRYTRRGLNMRPFRACLAPKRASDNADAQRKRQPSASAQNFRRVTAGGFDDGTSVGVSNREDESEYRVPKQEPVGAHAVCGTVR